VSYSKSVIIIEYHTQNFDEEDFENQRLECGIPSASELSPTLPVPSTSGTQKTLKPIPTTLRKRVAKAKVSDQVPTKRSSSLLPPRLPIPAPPVVKVIQGSSRNKLLQILISESAALAKPKKFYDLPEEEYLIHHIGEKVVNLPLPSFQVVFAENRADGVKNYILVTRPFTALPTELRGTLVPPLAIYSKLIEGKKFTDIKFLG
jgi:hypothetical protein